MSAHCVAEYCALGGRENARFHVLVERIHHGGRLPDVEGRPGRDRWDEPLQPAAAEDRCRQFGLEPGHIGREGSADTRRHRVQEHLDPVRRQDDAGVELAARTGVEPYRPVLGVEVDLGDIVVGEGRHHVGPKKACEHLAQPVGPAVSGGRVFDNGIELRHGGRPGACILTYPATRATVLSEWR